MHYFIRPAAWGMMLLLVLPLPTSGAEADGVIGLWSTPENKSRIEIFKCGERYCGRIAELKEPLYPPDDEQGMGGQPKIDRNNPNPDLRDRTLVGLPLMEGFRYAGRQVWEEGTIYDPESGKVYRCKMTLADRNTLEVRGFIGISLIGRTSVWTR